MLFAATKADIVRAFATFVRKGSVERKERTMPWCASCNTVLAKAEIEYKTRLDPSCYVMFPLLPHHRDDLLRFLDLPSSEGEGEGERASVSLLAWTTTPWTLPMNRALVLNPSGVYALVDLRWEEGRLDTPPASLGEDCVLGRKRKEWVLLGLNNLQELCAALHLEATVLGQVEASYFQSHGVQVHHPFVEGLTVPVVLDDMVALKEKKEVGEEEEAVEEKERCVLNQKGIGTAVVHAAPGCGAEVHTYLFLCGKRAVRVVSVVFGVCIAKSFTTKTGLRSGKKARPGGLFACNRGRAIFRSSASQKFSWVECHRSRTGTACSCRGTPQTWPCVDSCQGGTACTCTR